ncbi:hypothetical protein [Paraburkholderia sp. BL9I2N2]|uniref:hypothetical protein n=1 Tax=Paraburkholderia sp. BL9I2N2 TaxID=1938809 RepID=UPI00104FB8E6|nr:hypothetical protein [Paraburkholderia sp. BL9I2N2]TCK87347.1 hypothetical protein B0G74_7886 [Paraburkholderia sp. BL9I2N2]
MNFYVYELVSESGAVMYIGKGSGRRLAVQRKAFQLDGHEVARFKSEKDAYQFERQRIDELKPFLNIHPGGNGGTVQKKRKPRITEFEKECLRLGSKVVAARLALRFGEHLVEPSKLDAVRKVAYG